MGSAYVHWAGFQGLVARVCLFHCSLSASGLYYLEEFLVSFFFFFEFECNSAIF